ncbi:MAG: hypothetical protein WCS97_03760 [Candidatus Paceibacterota bacterium]
MDGWKSALVLVLIIGGIVHFSNNSQKKTSSFDSDSYFYPSNSGEKNIDRDEAIYGHWDEIKDYINGTETIGACLEESGNCYSLDADIYHGEVNQIYFENGGYLYFGADIDENGSASDFDQNGRAWDFDVDMNSSTIDNAISEWADESGYNIQ